MCVSAAAALVHHLCTTADAEGGGGVDMKTKSAETMAKVRVAAIDFVFDAFICVRCVSVC
jgi:hypothetical protein